MEKWTIIEHLLSGYPDFEESGQPEEQRQEGKENLADLLEKLSPNWREADSCRDIQTRPVTVHGQEEE
jgi:hypothetical protein